MQQSVEAGLGVPSGVGMGMKMDMDMDMKMPGLPGGVTREDAVGTLFDIGMGLSALILVPLTLAVFAFPFCIDGIDINSVGPPPMQ